MLGFAPLLLLLVLANDQDRLVSPQASTIFAFQAPTTQSAEREPRRDVIDATPPASGAAVSQTTREGQRMPGVAADPDSVSDSPTELKWNPGHGVKAQGNHARANQQEFFDAVYDQLPRVMAADEFEFVYNRYAWGGLEPARGEYNWAVLHQHLDWLHARGKSLLIGIETKCFSSDCGGLAPSDLTGDIVVGRYPMLATYRERVMDRFIEFMEALADEFDDHPAVTAFELGTEICPSWGGNAASDYTNSKLLTQWARKQRAASTLFQRTTVYTDINCDIGNNSQMLIENAYQLTCNTPGVTTKLGRSSPDMHNDPGRRLFYGDGNAVRDYRGLIPHLGIVDAPNLGGKDDRLPLSNIIAEIRESEFTHVAWITTATDAPLAAILDTIRSAAPSIQQTVECD